MTIFRLMLCLGCAGLVMWACGKDCSPSTNQRADAFCVPDGGLANQSLTLEIRESCGGCAEQANGCSVTREGNTITLSLDGESCVLPPNTACAAVCRQQRFSCTVDALPEGTYTVTANTNPPQSRTLVVGATGSATCALP